MGKGLGKGWNSLNSWARYFFKICSRQPADFEAVFDRLRSILVPYAQRPALKQREALRELSPDGAVHLSENPQKRLARLRQRMPRRDSP
jgi:hypothetical protein